MRYGLCMVISLAWLNFSQYLNTHNNAFVADVAICPSDQLFYLSLTFLAEMAVKEFFLLLISH